MTLNQVRWAEKHDWYVSSCKGSCGYTVEVIEHVRLTGGTVVDLPISVGHYKTMTYTFYNYDDLKRWAGY